MADYFYGLNRGQAEIPQNNVTQGSSTGSTDIEVRIAVLTPNWSRNEVVNALDAIKRRILDGDNTAGYPGL